MDRRYREARFYNGTPAATGASERGERLVRSYLARARRQNEAGQSYGGSTGGASSVGGGQAVIAGRNVDIKNAREIFRTEGIGSFGARANLAEARGFRQPRPTGSAPAAG